MSYGEMAIGAALVNMYLNTGMTASDGIRPTQDGLALAKDSWLLGIAASLILDSVVIGEKRSRK